MRLAFFPLSSNSEVEQAVARVAQEFGVYDDKMPAYRLFFLSDKVLSVWDNKVKAQSENKIYIGG